MGKEDFSNWKRLAETIGTNRSKDFTTFFVVMKNGLRLNGWTNSWLDVKRDDVAIFACGKIFTFDCPLAYRRRVIGLPYAQEIWHIVVFADRIYAINDKTGLATVRSQWDKSVLFSPIQLVPKEGCSIAAKMEKLQ